MKTKQIAVGKARGQFSSLIHDVERGSSIELTRRGRPVAVLLAAKEYARLVDGSKSFERAFEEYRRRVDLAALDIDPGIFDGLRDRAPGRGIRL